MLMRPDRDDREAFFVLIFTFVSPQVADAPRRFRFDFSFGLKPRGAGTNTWSGFKPPSVPRDFEYSRLKLLFIIGKRCISSFVVCE